MDGNTQYLTCVCMNCLERSDPERTIRCRFCNQKWDGSSLVLGTMYSYDIFMAMPCCTERLKVSYKNRIKSKSTAIKNLDILSFVLLCKQFTVLSFNAAKILVILNLNMNDKK